MMLHRHSKCPAETVVQIALHRRLADHNAVPSSDRKIARVLRLRSAVFVTGTQQELAKVCSCLVLQCLSSHQGSSFQRAET